jgi:hypothetical protein
MGFIHPYNVAVQYLQSKYPTLIGRNLTTEKRAELPHLDLKLFLLVGQYFYSITIKQELIDCLHEINLEFPNTLPIFEISIKR